MRPQTEADRVRASAAAGRILRSVNFHSTPRRRAAELDEYLRHVAASFSSVTTGDIDAALASGSWSTPRPPVVLAFFNGFRDNHEVALPLLEAHGLTGWFFVATGWLALDAAEQRDFALRGGMRLPEETSDPAGRIALDWDQVRELSLRHEIASHTRSHSRVDAGDRARLRAEIVGSQEDLIRHLGRPAAAFAWLQGTEYGISPSADELLLEAGYRYLFSNLRLQRISAGS